MGIEIFDKSGSPPSLADVKEAQAVMRKALVVWIGKLPPEMAVNVANIYRCLQYLEEIMPRGDS